MLGMGMDFTPLRTLQGVTTQPVSESAVPNNGKVGNHVICSHSCPPGALGLILMYFFLYISSVFRLVFQAKNV